jgi:hypothetical protein
MIAALLLLATLTDADLAQSIRSTNVQSAGERVIVWAPPAWPAEKRADVTASLDATVARVETALGRKHPGKIEYVLAPDEVPSHVYRGYDHAVDDPPIVFLSGLDSGESPHIHETVHLVAGEFGSLLLREGLATYVQFQIQPGKMRPLVKLGEVTDVKSLDAVMPSILAEHREQVMNWLAHPVKKVDFKSRPERGLFYAVSTSFTAFLIERVGFETVMKAYASPDPKKVIEAWPELVAAWAQLRPSAIPPSQSAR